MRLKPYKFANRWCPAWVATLTFFLLSGQGSCPRFLQAQAPTDLARPSVVDVSFDDIKFEMEKGAKFSEDFLTEKIRGYDGKTLRIRGFIRPSFKQSGLTKFVFVRDNQECCFGPGAALYDCIMVQLAEGKETEYSLRPVTVKGTFYFKQYKGPDGEIWAIYRMRDAVVE